MGDEGQLRKLAQALQETGRCHNFVQLFPTRTTVARYAPIVQANDRASINAEGGDGGPPALSASQLLASALFGPRLTRSSVMLDTKDDEASMDDNDSKSDDPDDPANARNKPKDEASPSLRPAIGSVGATSPANVGKNQSLAEVHSMSSPKSRPSSASSQSSGRRKLSHTNRFSGGNARRPLQPRSDALTTALQNASGVLARSLSMHQYAAAAPRPPLRPLQQTRSLPALPYIHKPQPDLRKRSMSLRGRAPEVRKPSSDADALSVAAKMSATAEALAAPPMASIPGASVTAPARYTAKPPALPRTRSEQLHPRVYKLDIEL